MQAYYFPPKGKRYEADDHEIIQINRNTTESIAIIQGPIMIVDAFPWIQNIIPKFFLDKWTGRKVLIEHQEHFYKLSRVRTNVLKIKLCIYLLCALNE